LVAVSPLSLPAQVRKRAAVTTPPILERNIRAELSFLASDAMQGRGSGTVYERIAAEYVGSQFRQFGLEPAGDVDSSGNKGFVQRVSLETSRFTEPPTFTVTSGSNTHKWKYGRDFLVSALRASRISGELQVIEPTGTPAKGAIVVIKLAETNHPEQRRNLMMKAVGAGAVAVVLPETEANRKTRQAGDARLPNLPARNPGDQSGERQFAVIALPKDAMETLIGLPPGARAEFAGTIQRSEAGATWNAIGVLRGTDPSGEAILLSAHLDHLGVQESLSGDNIFNGADDDASGCVAVLELARVLAARTKPRRTIYFICFGSEERGGYGSRYFISNSPVPVEKIVANLNFEMLGRPDEKVPAGTLWLTGFERSTLGPELARQGAALVGDPHPEQNFFQRSDNYTLALRGVVAHTVSSFGLHKDYHRPSDDISTIDFAFMTRSINSMVKPIQWLSNSRFRPVWLPGQAPTR
ncbi:MAG TPA: M20/M25/M40 family metallo-hydrolase, partial [Pyrinomonadaceae bacterium]|nr:M20/M25/M40 family metallo-hydrolase [Pyrinomonadaceae bacterium]